MAEFVNLDNLSPQFIWYLLLLHTIVLGWIVHIFINLFYKKSEQGSTTSVTNSSVRVVHVNDKRVTVESCHWLNSILNWLHMNASNTPDLVKIWLTMLNERLKTDVEAPMQFKINGIVPGSLPPTLTNVYCSNICSNVQCIAMHIESTKLGFFMSMFENNNASGESTDTEVAITKLSGELIFQVLTRQTHYSLTVKFIGDPELKVSSDMLQMGQAQSSDGAAGFSKSEETTLECVVKSEDADRSAVEEKLKEVICNTIVNIPLTQGKPCDEAFASNLVPESSSSCVDNGGKLLVKVIKASGLNGMKQTDVLDVYCVVSSKEPQQRKKTKTIKGTKDPVWNESHVLDIGEKTTEITFDLLNELKTSEETNFLGQVIVPLAMIGRDQTCRLILPILPTSSKNGYVTGQMNLEFTYGKDRKAFEAPMEEPSAALSSIPGIVPLVDHETGHEDVVVPEQIVSERSKHEGYETDPELFQENQKQHDMLQELVELDMRAGSGDCLKTETNQETEEPVDETKTQPSQQSSPTGQPVEISAVVISSEQPVGTRNNLEASELHTENIETSQNNELLVLNENLMQDLSPNTKRKVFRKAFRMRINRKDRTTSEKIDTDAIQDSAKRHSFSDEENIENTRISVKSGSDASLISLYGSNKSALVVETGERGQLKYYQIPPLMARRGTFDHKGTKLHICNDHLFVATHFAGALPSCNVCNLPLTGYFGKQGYECRDCHMIAHKRCHYETNSVCTNSTLSSLKIIILDDELDSA